MGNWDDYRRDEREEEAKVTGKQRCVITAVEEAVSKTSGKPMIIVSVRPSGCRFAVKWYAVKGEWFNRQMTSFFDAVDGVSDGDFNFLAWVGCEIGANLVVDENNYLKVKYWLSRRELDKLPPFEGQKPERQVFMSLDDDSDSESDLPF